MSTLKVNAIRGTGASSDAISVNSTDGTCTAKITNNLSNRNKVINGNMQIAQRSASVVRHANGDPQMQTLDRWGLWMAATGGAINMSQSTESPNGFSNSLKLQCESTDSSIASGDLISLGQGIEAQNLQDLGVGTSDAKQITISWYMKAVNPKTLTLNCYFPDATNDKWFNKNFTPTTSWARYSVTLPASTGGVINNDNGNGFRLGFTPFCGTTYSQSSDSTAWSATEKYAVSGIGNFLDSTSNILYITGVQLEVGDVATDFEHRSYGDELARCQRYCQKITKGDNNHYFGAGYYYNATNIYMQFRCCPQMRTIPTLVQTTGSNYYNFYRNGAGDSFDGFTGFQWMDGTDNAGVSGAFYVNSGVSGTGGQAGGFFSSNDACKILLSAEL